jgi:hypothetical protein
VRSWAAIALGLALAAGCSGGDDDAAESPPRTDSSISTEDASADASSTTTEPPATTTTTVPSYSFDGSVPPPELVNTGTDYEAIYRSLEDYQRWLYAHNPEPDLVDEIVAEDSDLSRAYVDAIGLLRRDNVRAVDEGLEIESFGVASETPDAATLRIEYQPWDRVLLNSDGIETDRESIDYSVVALLVRDAAGRWRLAAADDAGSPTVKL